MKQYPRIARLSTVGLRQHQAFDYDFHPFRTDFVGESGCGKSMIADLLQLILVGSEYFYSATDAMGGDRLPDGMVLKEKEQRGAGIGYAFLSIEVAQEQFIIIGTYIETSVRNTTAFVIQAGYEEETILPLPRKLSFEDIVKDEKILPLADLATHLEDQSLICHSWTHKKGYYKFLYKNGLLSLDLSVGDKLIKDYAAIIQSFSRGKPIDTQKGDNLKHFLFGDDKRKAIFSKYQDSIKELRTAFEEYGQNIKEIELIEQKQKSLKKLLGQETESKERYSTWIYTRCMFYYQEEKRIRQEIKEILHDTETAYNSLLTLEKVIIHQAESTTKQKEQVEEEVTIYKNHLTTIAPAYDRVKRLKEWLSKFQITANELKVRYKERKRLASLKMDFDKVIQLLVAKGLLHLFESIVQSGGKSVLIDVLDEQKKNIDEQLQEKKSLRQFVDVNNSNSLGQWAMQMKTPFSLQDESILMHYKALATRRQFPKYLREPQIFLEKKSIVDPDDNGFWLYWNGLREYIPFVKQRLFTPENMSTLQTFLAQWTKNLETDIKELEQSLLLVVNLRKAMLEERNFDGFLEAYAQKESVTSYIPDTLEQTSEEEFYQCLNDYSNADEIERAHTEKTELFAQAVESRTTLNQYLKQLSVFRGQIQQLTTNLDWIAVAADVHALLKPDDIQLITDDAQQLKYYLDSLDRKADKELEIRTEIARYRQKLRTFDLTTTYNKWKDVIRQKTDAEKMYEKEFQRLPTLPDHNDRFGNGDQEKALYEQSKNLFYSSYQETTDQYLANEAYRLVNVFDCKELGRLMLPAAFQGSDESADMIEQVNHYLTRINETNRELSKRKLQKIRDLLDDISDEVSSRLTLAKKIDNFLNDKEKEITGGHRVRLKVELSKDYPKQWIDTFQHLLDSNSNELVSEKLVQGISLEEKMIAAFQTCAPGATSRPKIEKLLDPNAYLEVSFSMESSKGQVNKGSTGQSYAGIALLCIARLSIIGSTDERKAPPGIRFMPIDEAEGLGSNYDMLYHIAQEYDYQIISLSINPLGKFQDGQQYIYMLQKNTETEEDVNYQPYAIFCEEDKNIARLN